MNFSTSRRHGYHSLLLATAFVCSLCQGAAQAATLTLYYSTKNTSYGYSNTNYTLFSEAIRAAFGAANIFEVTDFSAPGAAAAADAIIVNARLATDTLSAAEQANLLAFIDAGKPLLFIGEHGSWEGWNNSFLGLFGDAFETRTTNVNAGIVTGPVHPLHITGDTLPLAAAGTITGGNGTPLYRLSSHQTMAALYGPAGNAVAVLDTYPFASIGSGAVQFGNRMADWLHASAASAAVAPIPVPAAAVLLPGALLVLATRRRRRALALA